MTVAPDLWQALLEALYRDYLHKWAEHLDLADLLARAMEEAGLR